MADKVDNSKLIQSLTKKKPLPSAQTDADTKGSAPKSAKDAKKGGSLWKDAKKKLPPTRTMIDFALFAGACYLIYKHGKDIAGFVDNAVPTE